MAQYALARHVFVCMQGEHVVFLDVRQDRYFALEAASTSGLRELVSGWPVESHDSSGSLTQVVSLLLERGILIGANQEGKDASPVNVPLTRAELVAEALDESPRLGPASVLRFVRAALAAHLLLKYRRLEHVIAPSAGSIGAAFCRVESSGRAACPRAGCVLRVAQAVFLLRERCVSFSTLWR